MDQRTRSGSCSGMASYLVVIKILSLLVFPLAGELKEPWIKAGCTINIATKFITVSLLCVHVYS